LTLTLEVLGVRADGYHLLGSEMVSVSLFDSLDIGVGDSLRIEDEVVGGRGIGSIASGADNLVNRALRLAGRKASVQLTKRIPAGAGLGGGSADAGAILWWAGALDPIAASKIGADVPFCLTGGHAQVGGIGEVIAPLPHEDRLFTLLIPPIEISTPAVYGAWDEGIKPSRSSGLGNDLQPAAFAVAPRLSNWSDLLHEITGERPRLAGSGSTLFVEGDPATLGTSGISYLELGDQVAPLLHVRTVPARRAR
jgi:4-diphosphocytidyl-2-C-methyl-D-erythritol kinase